MRMLAIYTNGGGDGPVTGWEFVDTTAVSLGADLATTVAEASIPTDFETEWMDYQVLAGALLPVGAPAGETDLAAVINTDYGESLFRMNNMSIFQNL